MGDRTDDFTAAIAELENKTEEPSALGGEEHDFRQEKSEEVPAPEASPKPETGEAKPRGPDGKFAPKTESKDTLPADKEQKQEVKEQKPAQQEEARAPISWKPEEREHWATIDPVAKAAVLRRDREVDAALRTSAEARQLQQDFQRVTGPYEAFFRAENATALQAVETLMQTAAALRTAPPGQKANLVADLIQTYGIDLQTLDSALAARLQGRQAPGHPSDQVAMMIQRELAPVKQFMGSIQKNSQTNQQALEQQAEQAWESFANDPKNEFAQDLREDIADLLEYATKRGQTLSLQDAYKRATLLHPTISGIVQSRQQASGSAQQTAAARRALNAAASIPSNGAAPGQDDEADAGDGSIRSDLASTIRQLSKSR